MCLVNILLIVRNVLHRRRVVMLKWRSGCGGEVMKWRSCRLLWAKIKQNDEWNNDNLVLISFSVNSQKKNQWQGHIKFKIVFSAPVMRWFNEWEWRSWNLSLRMKKFALCVGNVAWSMTKNDHRCRLRVNIHWKSGEVKQFRVCY